MAIQTDYFNRIGYKGKYHIGDRVFGKWNGIPFIGSIGNDRVIDDTGPHVTVTLDLPIFFENKLTSVIICKHRAVKRLTNF